jgi:hypothetical protein
MDFTIFPSLLKYGAVGLGMGLAILAFQLLRKEQSRKSIRKGMLQSIYVFMSLSLTFALAGLVAETISRLWSAPRVAEMNKLHAKVMKLEGANAAESKTQYAKIKQLDGDRAAAQVSQAKVETQQKACDAEITRLKNAVSQKNNELTKLHEQDDNRRLVIARVQERLETIYGVKGELLDELKNDPEKVTQLRERLSEIQAELGKASVLVSKAE